MEAEIVDLGEKLIDEYQDALKNIIGNMTAECSIRDLPALQDPEETKNSIEQAAHQFTECYQKLEQYFTRQTLMFAAYHPEQPLLEEMVEMRADLDRKSTLLARHKDRLFQWQKLMKPEYTAELMAECQKREKSADAVVEIKPCIDAVMEDIKPPKTNGDPRSSETTIKQEVPDMDTGESDSNQKSSS